jgi:ATP-binding cassette subfamily B protein
VNALIGAVRAEGCVEIDGRDLSTCTSSDRAGFFGLLTQEFGRYEFTVREVVGLGGPGPVTDEDMARALVGAHADGLVAALPHGLDTQLGQQWHGVGLSGGQWQRLALARIHVRGAGIWILDEPTSAIDAETEEKIFQELRRTAEERITIVVSHRAWTLRAMDRIYVMDGGRIVQEGRYEELVDVPGRFAEIFAMQTR